MARAVRVPRLPRMLSVSLACAPSWRPGRRIFGGGFRAACPGIARRSDPAEEASMKTSKIVIAGTAALAASGVLGVTPPAVQASSAQPATWTQQHPATRPPARYDASMAYDAATRTAVLFGGQVGDISFLSDTWTWHGTTWTQRHPAVHPGARGSAAMAYDATTRTVVLFSGFHRGHRGGSVTVGTWTWNGATWTRQHPAASPAARFRAAVAYDAATGSVVLFGGAVGFGGRWGNDTWTWNGTTWTQQHPATSPPARAFAS